MTDLQRKTLEKLSAAAPAFNFDQYQVEHAPTGSDTAIMVKASAGTGKTSVMIDRIMHLFATVPDLMPADICMITFTNKAASNMAAKIQERLVETASLVKSRRWREVLENSSGLNVSTIDSFFHDILSTEGSVVGYGVNARLRGLKDEKKRIVLDIIEERFENAPFDNDPSKSSVTIHKIVDMVLFAWDKLHSLGYYRDDIGKLDFGSLVAKGDCKREIIGYVRDILIEAEARYQVLKHRTNSYGVDDIKGELDDLSRAKALFIHRRPFRYLFVDEFQDTDNSQIACLDWLRRRFDCQLFAVGDVKQSIYRFRGAEESAFDELEKRLRASSKHSASPAVKKYVLKKNYRSVPGLIDAFNEIFSYWGTSSERLLLWDADAEAGIAGKGRVEFCLCGRYDSEKELVRVLKRPGQNCVLTRTNGEARKIAKLCRTNGLPCIAKLDGGFYQCAPVRHLHALLGALLYPENPRRLFNALITPYFSEAPDLEAVLSLEGNDDRIRVALTRQLEKSSWNAMREEVRTFSFFRFLESALDRSRPVEQYAVRRSSGFRPYVENNELIDVEMYRSNLNKLLQILYEKFTGDYPTLLSVYSFLDLKLKTDRTETMVYPEILSIDGHSVIETMTVHKAKGLEFENVIIPYTWKDFFYENPDETDDLKDCIVDRGPDGRLRLGWRLGRLCNDNYEAQQEDESKAVRRDEARLLYVAMTRAQKSLVIFTSEDASDNTWAGLLDVCERNER